MNEVLKNKIQEFINYQNSLIEKTQSNLLEAKDEYMKLMEFVNSKDFEIEQLQFNSENQKNVIQSLEERLLSIFVLEYKIKNLDQENKKKIEKMKREYEEIIKKLKFSKSPAMQEDKDHLIYKKKQENENKFIERKIKDLEKTNQKLKTEITVVKESSSKEIKGKNLQIQNLKENLRQFQSKNYHFPDSFTK